MQIIMRNELIHDISDNLKKNKIIYLEAPCGWGKTTLLYQLEEAMGRQRCTFIHNSEITRMKFMMDMNKPQGKEGESRIFLVDNMGEWVVSGNIGMLMDYIRNEEPESRFVMAGRIPLPSQLLPYKLTSQIKIYGKDRLKYSVDELNAICANKYKENKEQLKDLYEICHGMPLFLAVAEGFLEGAVND